MTFTPTNTLLVYDPLFYAQETLLQLRMKLGMANTVHRGFELERRAKSGAKGSTVEIARPAVLTAQDFPGTDEVLETQKVSIKLDNAKTARFAVPDPEYAYAEDRLIEDHVSPAAYAIAKAIDDSLCELYKDVPWTYDLSANPGESSKDITGPNAQLFENRVPVDDNMGMIYYMVNGRMRQGLQDNQQFTTWSGSGSTGEQAQLTGALGERYGVRHFANQNVKSHTSGTLTDGVGNLDGAVSAGATSMTIDGLGAGTVVKGDSFSVAGSTQRYSIQNTATASGGAITVEIWPPAVQDYNDNSAVTIELQSSVAENMQYHRNAFALVMAELPAETLRQAAGARVETVFDDETGLALRSRVWYNGDDGSLKVSVDALWGVRTLDPNMAVRCRQLT